MIILYNDETFNNLKIGYNLLINKQNNKSIFRIKIKMYRMKLMKSNWLSIK